MKQQLLTLFKDFLNSEVKAGNQTDGEAKQNYSDLKRMNEARLFNMAKSFNLIEDSQFQNVEI